MNNKYLDKFYAITKPFRDFFYPEDHADFVEAFRVALKHKDDVYVFDNKKRKITSYQKVIFQKYKVIRFLIGIDPFVMYIQDKIDSAVGRVTVFMISVLIMHYICGVYLRKMLKDSDQNIIY